MLNSAAGVMFPPVIDPPISTISLMSAMRSGRSFKASAMLVRGPTGINVSRPGYSSIFVTMRSTALPAYGLVVGGGSSMLPRPDLPCTCVEVTS